MCVGGGSPLPLTLTRSRWPRLGQAESERPFCLRTWRSRRAQMAFSAFVSALTLSRARARAVVGGSALPSSSPSVSLSPTLTPVPKRSQYIELDVARTLFCCVMKFSLQSQSYDEKHATRNLDVSERRVVFSDSMCRSQYEKCFSKYKEQTMEYTNCSFQ